METQYQKSVNISYLVVAALVAYIVFTASGYLAAAYDLEARVRNVELLMRIGAFVIAAVVFFGLYKNQRANQFMNEVATELMRVTWPTQKETTNATFVVIIMVLISGMILGLLDYIWTALLKLVL